MVERKDSRLVWHGHDFRYGNSTDFRGHQGLIGKTVGPFSCESSADASGNHSAFVAVDVEAVGGARSLVQRDAENVGVAGDGVADPASVVVGQGGAVGGQHQPVVWMLAQVPDGCPAGCAAAFPVSRRHRQHDLDALAGGDALKGLVNQVQMAGLHLLAVGEHGGQGARGAVHGDLTLYGEQLGLQFRGGLPGDF